MGVGTYLFLERKNENGNLKKSPDILHRDSTSQQSNGSQEHNRECVNYANRKDNAGTSGDHLSGDLDQEQCSSSKECDRVEPEKETPGPIVDPELKTDRKTKKKADEK